MVAQGTGDTVDKRHWGWVTLGTGGIWDVTLGMAVIGDVGDGWHWGWVALETHDIQDGCHQCQVQLELGDIGAR